MLAGLGTVRAQFDGLPQGDLRLLQQACILHDAPGMLERHQAVLQHVRRALGRQFRIGAPLLDRLRRQPRILQGAPEIDVGGPEFRIELQAGAQRVDGARKVALLPERDGIIEQDEMQIGMRVVEGDPSL